MPPSSRYSRASSRSPTRSTSFMSTATSEKGPQPVKRLFITGKAQTKLDGEGDGAAIKMYLRMSISPTAVAPGDTIPLFPEDNVKILKGTVHPLDSSFIPYSFSPSKHPELTKAIQVLNLPSRSRESYMSLFESSLTSSPQSSGGGPYDKRYSGEILVSGYQVSYVLPKEFPSRIYASDNFSKRSANDMHFMAVIQLWVPYLSTPPYSPYHLALPVPKCLSNHIKLRIFSPVPTSSPLTSSMASLSSAEGDIISWDIRAEPHVVTKPSKQLLHKNSYNNFADDESSDSSGSKSNECFVRGSFPSTEHLRISWAVPKKAEDVPMTADGRSRVGIRDVKSDMTCSVLRRDKGKTRSRKGSGEDGIVMRVDYTATCRGVWFPGVATLLGMDLALEAEDCDVSWAPGGDSNWTIVGSAGYTGFSVGSQPKASASRKPTEDAPPMRPSSSSPEKRREYSTTTRLSTAEPASLSTASLLRAPLPSSPHPDELSFDESPDGTPVSSIGSLATIPSDPERGRSRASSSARERRHTDAEPEDVVEQRPPKVPITIHLNMNELGPASQNEITIKVIGTIMLRPRENNGATSLASPISSGSMGSDDEQEQSSAVMPIPQFHVIFTEQETISNIVLNESDMLSVDIYNSTGNITDAQSRKTVLQPGGKTKCGSGGGRLALRNATSNRSFLRRQDSTDNMRRPSSRSRAPSYIQRNTSTASLYRDRSYSMNARPKRDSPLMIPSVSTTITPLSRNGRLPTEYAVRVQLPAPSGADSEWLEFGLALPEQPTIAGPESVKSASGKEKRRPPIVEVASASVGGVSVQYDTSLAAKPDSKLPALGLTFEETSTKEWITWVKIHVGDTGGGNVEILYVVDDEALAVTSQHTGWKFGWMDRSRDEVRLNILLPTFFLPVGIMEVNVESLPKVKYGITSNLDHQQDTSNGPRLLKYSLEEFFYPNLTLTVFSDPFSQTSSTSSSWRMIGLILCMMPTVMALLAMADKQVISAELAQAHESLESCSMALQSPMSLPDPVTITTTTTMITPTTTFMTTTVMSTIYTSSSTQVKWQNKQNSVSSEEPESASTAHTSRQSSINFSPTPVLVPTFTTVFPSPSTSSSSSFEETEMADVRDMSFLWPTHLDLPTLEIPEAARITINKIWNGVGFVWYLFQKVLHYPLDPP